MTPQPAILLLSDFVEAAMSQGLIKDFNTLDALRVALQVGNAQLLSSFVEAAMAKGIIKNFKTIDALREGLRQIQAQFNQS